MKFCMGVLWVHTNQNLTRPQKIAPPGGRHLEFKNGRHQGPKPSNISESIGDKNIIPASIPMFSSTTSSMVQIKN